MPLLEKSQHTHHHSLLAGASAGAVAVVAVFGLVLLAWHTVSGMVGEAVIVIVWAVSAAVIVAVLAAALYAALWLRHRIRHPEVLGRRAVRAEVVPEAPAAVPAPPPAAELPAAGTHTHYHFDSAEAVEAALKALQERQATSEHGELS